MLIAIGIALLAGGVLTVLLGAGRMRLASRLRDRGAAVTAVVARTSRDWWPMLFDPLGGPATRPVVRFRTDAGEEIEVRTQPAPQRVRAGDEVAVLYDRGQPRVAALESSVLAGNGIVLVLAGAALAVVALALVALAVVAP